MCRPASAMKYRACQVHVARPPESAVPFPVSEPCPCQNSCIIIFIQSPKPAYSKTSAGFQGKPAMSANVRPTPYASALQPAYPELRCACFKRSSQIYGTRKRSRDADCGIDGIFALYFGMARPEFDHRAGFKGMFSAFTCSGAGGNVARPNGDQKFCLKYFL